MRKVFDRLKKYLVIGFVLSVITDTWGIVYMIRSNTLPIINLLYIIKFVFGTLGETVLCVPFVAAIDGIRLCHMSLVKDFKESDKKGKITIIVVCIIILLRKIVIWTR